MKEEKRDSEDSRGAIDALLRRFREGFLAAFAKLSDTHFGGNRENAAIALVFAASALACALILLVPKSEAGRGHAHEHSQEHALEDGHGHAEIEDSVELDDAALASAGITLAEAGPRTLDVTLRLRGRITLNRERSVTVAPRYPGTIQRVTRRLGDRVASGDLLAVIESAAARSSFEVRSGMPGVVVSKQAVLGAYAGTNETLFTIADLATVWIELDAPVAAAAFLRTGLELQVSAGEENAVAESRVDYVSPVVEPDSQSIFVRGTIGNASGLWRPGTYVEARVRLELAPVAVAVPKEALHEFEGKTVVFARKEGALAATPVTLGKEDDAFVEITSGLAAGTKVAGTGSFTVKAELLKSTAAHEH